MADECMARKDIYMYGMLVAQAGVMIATFGLAVRLRGLLWASRRSRDSWPSSCSAWGWA